MRIPHLYDGRNKTFFEIGAEGTHYSKAGSTNILIPTPAQLNGDFMHDLHLVRLAGDEHGATVSLYCPAKILGP